MTLAGDPTDVTSAINHSFLSNDGSKGEYVPDHKITPIPPFPAYGAGKIKWWFFISFLHFAPMQIPTSPTVKKEQHDCHIACYNHLYPSPWLWWLLLSKHCRLGPRWIWYCHRTSSNCRSMYWFTLFSLWFCVQKLVQVAVNRLCITTDPPGM